VLSLGMLVEHAYGVFLGASLYVERLSCLNGMTTTKQAFQWKMSAGAGAQRSQLDWVLVGVANALAAFDDVVEKARMMAAVSVGGDAERMLLERARAMRLPRGYDDALLAAWRVEPDQTEWGMLNAFTRFATHSDTLNDRQRASLQHTAGEWAERFDMVSARLPRPIAEAVGASIYEDAGVQEIA
jgi:hypothetical protein